MNLASQQIKSTSVLITLLITMLFTTITIAADTETKSLDAVLAEHKGEVIYLDFWASWCVPCRRSFPWMNEMHKKYQAQGFTVVSVNLDAEQQLATQFLTATPANFIVVYDPQGLTAKQYKLKGMPSSYMIGRDGKLKRAHVGFFTDKKAVYEQEIQTLLKL